MGEYAPTMRDPESSNAPVHRNILVTDVKLIGVIFMNAKIMEHVLSLLSTTFQHQNANAREITVVLRVTLNCAQALNVETELVLMESVSVMKTTSTMETFV